MQIILLIGPVQLEEFWIIGCSYIWWFGSVLGDPCPSTHAIYVVRLNGESTRYCLSMCLHEKLRHGTEQQITHAKHQDISDKRNNTDQVRQHQRRNCGAKRLQSSTSNNRQKVYRHQTIWIVCQFNAQEKASWSFNWFGQILTDKMLNFVRNQIFIKGSWSQIQTSIFGVICSIKHY